MWGERMAGRTIKLSMLSAGLAGLLLAGCGSSAAPTTSKSSGPKPVKIAVFLASAANTYNEAELNGVQAAANKLHATVAKVFDGNFSTPTQVAQLQDAITSGQYQAFVIDANDGSSIVPEVKSAIKHGIKVAGMLAPIGTNPAATVNQIPGMTTEVSYSVAQNGANLGKAVIQACGNLNPCNVVYMPGLLTLPLERIRTDGFNNEVKSHTNIKVVSEQEGQYLAGTARTVMQNILQAHPNVNVYASSGDQMTAGAEQAVDSAGLKGKVKLIGNGASAPGVAAVQAGNWFATVVNLPFTEGQIAGTAVIKAVRGQPTGYPTWVNEIQYSSVGPIVDQQNAANFKAQWKG